MEEVQRLLLSLLNILSFLFDEKAVSAAVAGLPSRALFPLNCMSVFYHQKKGGWLLRLQLNVVNY